LLTLAERRLALSQSSAADNTTKPVAGEAPELESKENLAIAQDLAQQALTFDPLTPGALTDLGRIAESKRDVQRASSLMELAGNRALRDAFAQSWLLEHALAQNQLSVALVHLDAILRTQPEGLEKALPLLAAFVSSPEGIRPLAHLIATNPPWRTTFLKALTQRIKDHDILVRFYNELQAGPNPPSGQELQVFIDRLVDDGLIAQAYDAWIATLPPDRRPDARIFYNAGFQYELSGSPFDWKIAQSLGADIVVDGGPGEVPTLRVEFSGARVDFHNVSHLLMLTPGTYRFTGEVEAQELRTERGLWWRLFCSGPKGADLGKTDLIAQSTSWREVSLTFEVPPQGCRAQIIQLELPARVSLEKKIEGIVSFRKLAISATQASSDSSQQGPESDVTAPLLRQGLPPTSH
jgi:tetratricopeptide (TPR) repeat protein